MSCTDCSLSTKPQSSQTLQLATPRAQDASPSSSPFCDVQGIASYTHDKDMFGGSGIRENSPLSESRASLEELIQEHDHS